MRVHGVHLGHIEFLFVATDHWLGHDLLLELHLNLRRGVRDGELGLVLIDGTRQVPNSLVEGESVLGQVGIDEALAEVVLGGSGAEFVEVSFLDLRMVLHGSILPRHVHHEVGAGSPGSGQSFVHCNGTVHVRNLHVVHLNNTSVCVLRDLESGGSTHREALEFSQIILSYSRRSLLLASPSLLLADGSHLGGLTLDFSGISDVRVGQVGSVLIQFIRSKPGRGANGGGVRLFIQLDEGVGDAVVSDSWVLELISLEERHKSIRCRSSS